MASTVLERANVLSRLSAALGAMQPLIRDAVLIGSAVYAPDLARDWDVVVTSTAAADAHVRGRLAEALGAAAENLDIIVRHPGEPIGDLAPAIVAGRVLFGTGETMREAALCLSQRGDRAIASFDEAMSQLTAARSYLRLAARSRTGLLRDTHLKTAFDSLFHAARIAALTYMGSERTQWGGVDKRLPPPFGPQFHAIVSTLHVLYAYEGRFPQGQKEAAREFRRWETDVQGFVDGLRDLSAGEAADQR